MVQFPEGGQKIIADIFMKVSTLFQSTYLTSMILQWRKQSTNKWGYKSSSGNRTTNLWSRGGVTKMKKKASRFITAGFQNSH